PGFERQPSRLPGEWDLFARRHCKQSADLLSFSVRSCVALRPGIRENSKFQVPSSRETSTTKLQGQAAAWIPGLGVSLGLCAWRLSISFPRQKSCFPLKDYCFAPSAN